MVNWSTLPNTGTNNSQNMSLQKIEDEFGGDGGDIELGAYYRGGIRVPDVAWNYRIPSVFNDNGDLRNESELLPLSLNAFYGAVWGTFVNFLISGGGGGGGAGSSSGRGSNNIGNGNAGGASNISIDNDSNFGGTAAGGAAGLHGDSNFFYGLAGESSVWGLGGAIANQNTNGNDSPNRGAGGSGGGGDQASGKGDTFGNGGSGGGAGANLEGGSAGTDLANDTRYKYNSIITIGIGAGGNGGTGSFTTGGDGGGGQCRLTYDGDDYFFTSATDHVLGEFATVDDVP